MHGTHKNVPLESLRDSSGKSIETGAGRLLSVLGPAIGPNFEKKVFTYVVLRYCCT